MDAVLRLPRRRESNASPLIYHRLVAFCKAFHCPVASDKTTKPVRPFGNTHSASARQSRTCAWWGGPPYDRCYSIGSTETLPTLLCVSDFCEWYREKRDACDIIDITLKSRVIMHMITSTACRPTRRHVLSLSSARVHVRQAAWCLSRVEGRVIDEWRWGSRSLAFAGQLPWITQQHFVGVLQARRIDQVDVYFLFEWQRFCLWEPLG